VTWIYIHPRSLKKVWKTGRLQDSCRKTENLRVNISVI